MAAHELPEAEGPRCARFERMPRSERAARTLCAFANGDGGAVWIGVDSAGQIPGVEEPDDVRAELERVGQELIVPATGVSVEVVDLKGRRLVIARVEESNVRPVRAPGRDGALRAFHRAGSATRLVPRALLRAWSREVRAEALDRKARRVLRLLRQHSPRTEGLPLDEIAAASHTGQRSARRALDQLMAAGLIVRTGGERFRLAR